MRFRGQNPVYSRYGETYSSQVSEYQATYGGVIRKTGLLLLLVASVAYYFGTTTMLSLSTGTVITAVVISPIVAFIMVILAHSNPNLSFLYTIVYAIFEGIFIGFITQLVASYTDGPIVLYALGGTFGTVFVMLFVYGTGIVKVGERFRGFMYTAFITLMLLFFVYLIGYLTGLLSYTGSMTFYMTIIVFSIFVSTLYLLFDFDNVRMMVENGVDSRYEWVLSLGLIVVIVWLYLDILRLLAIVMNRD